MHDNAFEEIWFGNNSYGILGALPTDLMHAFLHKIIPYVVKTIVAPLTPTEKTSLDHLVDSVLVPIRQGEQSKYPCANFSCGISNLKLLTATEWAGVVFALSLVVHTAQGFQLFKKLF